MTATEYIYYGTEVGQPEYMESILSVRQARMTAAEVKLLKQWMADNGYDRLRIAEYNGEAPDFAGTVNV